MADRFFNLGLAAIHSGNIPEGVRYFEQAVQINPKDAETVACLGQSLFWLGRRNEGVAYLRQAGRLLVTKAKKSGKIDEIIALTEQLQSCDDFEGSIKLIQQAIQVNNRDARAFQLLAQASSRLNQNDQALTAVQLALKRMPDSPTLHILQAGLESRVGKSSKAKRRLESVLKVSEKLQPEEAFRAHKELAAVLDKLGEFDTVFEHLHAAADLSKVLPDMQSQDSLLVPDLLKTYQAEFDFELLNRFEFESERSPPVFLMGFLRSGTTLVQEVLAAHPDVFVADETEFVAAMRGELSRIVGNARTVPEQLRNIDIDGIKQLRRFYWRQVDERFGSATGKSLLVDKTTLNTIDLGLINCVFPDAKVLFVVRDPRDVCLSCFMQTMTPTPVTVHLSSWQGTVEFYARVMQWWLYIKPQMAMTCFEFRYEDAVAEFESTFRGVFEYLKLLWVPEVAEFHLNAANKFIASPSYHQVALPLYDSSLGRWRNYPDEFSEVEDTLHFYVNYFGYRSN